MEFDTDKLKDIQEKLNYQIEKAAIMAAIHFKNIPYLTSSEYTIDVAVAIYTKLTVTLLERVVAEGVVTEDSEAGHGLIVSIGLNNNQYRIEYGMVYSGLRVQPEDIFGAPQ